jgi:hypothetical protein
MAPRTGRLWLWHSHPQFFISFAATALFHLGMGALALINPESASVVPALERAHRIAPPHTWGWAFLITGAICLLGLFQNSWTLARAGLVMGFVICVVRFAAITAAAFDGAVGAITGVFPWLFIAGVHMAEMGEPPQNPATARR